MTKPKVAWFVLAVVVVAAYFVVGPILLILAINVLFGRENPIDFTHWCAAFVMMAMLRSTCRCRREAKAAR